MALGELARYALVRMSQRVHQLVAGEWHREYLDDAHAIAGLHRLLRHRDDDDGDADARLADLFSDLEAVDLAL